MSNMSRPAGQHRLVGHVSCTSRNQLVKIPSKSVKCTGVRWHQRTQTLRWLSVPAREPCQPQTWNFIAVSLLLTLGRVDRAHRGGETLSLARQLGRGARRAAGAWNHVGSQRTDTKHKVLIGGAWGAAAGENGIWRVPVC